MELGESIMDCVKREVKEESGLEVISAVPIAVYSDPRFSFVTAYGDPYQPLSITFLVKEWRGQLLATTDETLDAHFYSLKELPPNLPAVYHETLEDLLRHDGQIIVK
jgi:ADP-ribose pyrophosphatase YjhB (NUDIX family)